MIDPTLAAIKAELSGANAANYVSLSDADAATVLNNIPLVRKDVTAGTVAGYLELNAWAASDPSTMIYEKLVELSPTNVVAAKAVRMCSGGSAAKDFEMSDPTTFAKISAMLDTLVAAGMDAANKTGILALSSQPILTSQVTQARVLLDAATVPYTWSYDPNALNGGKWQEPNGNNYVQIVIKNRAGSQIGDPRMNWGKTLDADAVAQWAARLISDLVERDNAFVTLG